MIHRYNTFIKAINLTIDYIILNISMILAYAIVGHTYLVWENNVHYFPVVLVFNLVWLLSANITGMYESVLNRDSISTYRLVIKTYLLFVSFICVTIIIIIGIKAYFVTREYLFYAILLFGFFLSLWKLIFLSIRKSERKFLGDYRNVIIVGSGRIANDVYQYLSDNLDRGYRVVGFFDDDPLTVTHKELYMGNTNDCIEFAVTNEVDEIFCTLPDSYDGKIQQLMLDADKNLIRFKFIPQYYNFGQKPMQVQSMGHIPVISIRQEPLENMLNRFTKRLFDIVFSIFVVVFLLSWLFPILAIIIKLESKGPVLFVQLRAGRDNLPFKCFKFRSMSVTENKDEFVQATKNDVRVTKSGAFLRKSSLDELPQFINVILGNMSVVGPRPHPLKLNDSYVDIISSYNVRHFLKPGITGWAQVTGHRGETKTTEDMLARVEADVWYLENWSFLLDLKIIFLTFWNTVKGDKKAF
ncbi:undecaprenyl-phosphate glucose phosphotransferase [Mucilaginibacter koreensis]